MSVAKATCVIRGNGPTSSVLGIVKFNQTGVNGATNILIKISGLLPKTKYNLRICIFGDLSENFKQLGGIYNPFNGPHGSRTDEGRSVGSLGNFESNEEGVIESHFDDNLIKIIGPLSVLGRSMAISTQTEEDGGVDSSVSTILAAGVIGLASI